MGLGPTENPFKIVGVIVLTRFAEKFQPGWCSVHPPLNVMSESQANVPNGPAPPLVTKGTELSSELWSQRPYSRFLLLIWKSTRRRSSRRGATPESDCEKLKFCPPTPKPLTFDDGKRLSIFCTWSQTAIKPAGKFGSARLINV